MPFTLSHAAAALPFRRTRLVMPALVCGCFAPDLEYFLWLRPHGHFGHTLAGMFLFDLPAALILLLLFQRYARGPLVACLPLHLRERVHSRPSFSIDSVRSFALVCVSILVGTATHILWDSFTHTEYWLGRHWEFLSDNVPLPLFGERPWAGIFQYFSSVAGLVVILAWFVRWYRSTPPVHAKEDERRFHRDRLAIAGAFLLSFVGGLVRAAGPGIPNGVHGAQRFMTDASITAITLFCVLVLIYGFVRVRMTGGPESA